MDSNRPLEQQQSPGQSQSRPATSESSMGARPLAAPASQSDAYIPFLELPTSGIAASVPLPARRKTDSDLHHEYDLEAGLTTSPLSAPFPTIVTPERPTSATSSSEVSPLPAALLSTRRAATLSTDNNRTLHSSTLGSTVVPPMRESRRMDRRSSTLMRTGGGSEIDWIVPVEEKPHREKTVAERLEPTLLNAIAEKTKYAARAQLTGYTLNAAIGLQVLLGSLTTALSVVVKGSRVSVMTAVLGGFSTIVASYLARARGSNEPELSITRVKDLEQFIRECESFKLDYGHISGDKYDKDLEKYRGRFEELLGNANGERKLSTV